MKLTLYLVTGRGYGRDRHLYAIYADSRDSAINRVRKILTDKLDFSIFEYSAEEINPITPILIYEKTT